MAAYTDDYKNPLPGPDQVTVAILNAMNTNEINKGTAANTNYANGWPSESNFSYYKSGTTSGIKNYMAKTFGTQT